MQKTGLELLVENARQNRIVMEKLANVAERVGKTIGILVAASKTGDEEQIYGGEVHSSKRSMYTKLINHS